MIIQASNKEDRLKFFQDLYSQAQAYSETLQQKLNTWMEQYRGSRKIDPIPGQNTYPADATVVRNITYEFIESQISTYIPTPAVQPRMVSDLNTRCAKAVETMLNNQRDRLPMEELNDIDERYNPIYGGSVFLVEWDNSICTHNTVGDVKLSCLPPKRFCGQPNIFKPADMEYMFITFDTTIEEIYRKYGVDVSMDDKAKMEMTDAGDDSTATLVVCFYKNEKDKVCQFIWSGDFVVSDIDNYFSRKKKICRKCGKPEALCECKKPDIFVDDEEIETLDHEIQLSDGSTIPAMSIVMKDGIPQMEDVDVPVLDETGSPVMQDLDGVMLPMVTRGQQYKMEKTKIPYYEVNVFPIVIRKNTSAEESLLGQSDCEYIRDQQQEINKLESRILEKIIKSAVIPVVPEKYAGAISDKVYSDTFKARPEDAAVFRSVDLQVNVQQDVQQAERIYEQAKRILGITDSYRGFDDSTAKSGVAKQVQVQQSGGRLQSKRQMKNFAYSEIDKIIFQYYLAFADEPRPAVYRDAMGRLQNSTFSRYDFVRRDDNGDYYYDDDFLFSCTSNPDVDTDRTFLWEQNRQNFQIGAYGPPQLPQTQLIYWQNMEKAHYPYAQENVDRIQMEIERQQQLAMMQQQVDQQAIQMQGMQNELNDRKAYEQFLQDKLTGGTPNA